MKNSREGFLALLEMTSYGRRVISNPSTGAQDKLRERSFFEFFSKEFSLFAYLRAQRLCGDAAMVLPA
jgi:hypothetical protein